MIKSMLHRLLDEAQKSENLENFIKENCNSFGSNNDDAIDLLTDVWEMSQNYNIRTIRNISGMIQIEFSQYYNIPVRCIQDWESGKSKPTEYLTELLMCDVLNRKFAI